jgi:hypothetical protein
MSDTAVPPRRSWPLFVLAAGAFIPGLGLFLGAAAVTWGLVSTRPRAMLGAMIGAVGALLNLAGGAVFLWRVQDTPMFAEANAATARQDLARLVGALEDYHLAHGRYPRDLQVFTALPLSFKLINIKDNSAGVFRIPRSYQYRLGPDARTYVLFAVGADGRPGTGDDVFPALTDSVARRSGYRPPS